MFQNLICVGCHEEIGSFAWIVHNFLAYELLKVLQVFHQAILRMFGQALLWKVFPSAS